MTILELYRAKQRDEAWVQKFQSTSNAQKGKTFMYTNTNYRHLDAFFTQLFAFLPNDNLNRNQWARFSNGQELDKHRIVNLLNAGFVEVVDNTYHITDVGEEVLRVNSCDDLSETEKNILLLILISGYKTEDETLHLIRKVAEISTKLNKINVDGETLLKILYDTLFVSEKEKLFRKDAFWYLTFAYDQDFIGKYSSSSKEEKQEIHEYVVQKSRLRDAEDLIAKKFIPGGVYTASMFNDDVNVFFNILLILLLQDSSYLNYLQLVDEIYPLCNKKRIIEFMQGHEEIYKKIYNNSFNKLNNKMGVNFMSINKRLVDIEVALGLTNEEIFDDTNEDSILNKNLFGIHIKNKSDALSENNPHICIGWSSLGDLSRFDSKEDLRKYYEEQNPDKTINSVGQNVGQIWRFIKEAKIGDYVILGESSLIHIGKISSDYYFDNAVRDEQDSDYVNNRKVVWIKKNIDRNNLSRAFHHSIGSAMSFFTLNDYKSAVLDLINDSYQKDEEGRDSIDESKRITGGTNVILYGVPGSGKSWTIKNEYCDDMTKTERLVFHPDYTYSDFVGQILPKSEDGHVNYPFVAGPFTKILKRAYENPDEMYYLIIEEVNRGNAPAIFGDIFQLLDRDHNGNSEYSITNENIATYVYSEPDRQIYLPSNLTILCTMNTSDQNVFTLDTAFQRRWTMRLIENKFNMDDADDSVLASTAILDTNVTWEKFYSHINNLILEKNIKMTSSEDKRLGTHFINVDDLHFDGELNENGTMTKKSKSQNSKFAQKVLKYLWDDAFKFSKEDVFDTDKYKSLEDVLNDFLEAKGNERFKVFKEKISEDLTK